jgi:hypothetical protein
MKTGKTLPTIDPCESSLLHASTVDKVFVVSLSHFPDSDLEWKGMVRCVWQIRLVERSGGKTFSQEAPMDK